MLSITGESVEFFAAEGTPSTSTSISSIREVRFERETNRCLVMVSDLPQALIQLNRVFWSRCAIFRRLVTRPLFGIRLAYDLADNTTVVKPFLQLLLRANGTPKF